MFTKYYQVLLFGILLLFSVTACQNKQEAKAEKALTEAKLADDQDMLDRFKKIMSQQDELPAEPSEATQALSMALDASVAQEVEAILTQFSEENATNTNIRPSREDSTRLDSILNLQESKIENGAILIGVRNYDESYVAIRQMVESKGAKIESEEERSTEFRLENTLVIRTAPEHFQAIMSSLRELSVVIREKRLWKQDLSAQFVDLKTRLENKYEAKTRLEQFMKNAKKAEDILPIQRELDEVTEEIEAITRTARMLTQKAATSTITATFYQEVIETDAAEAAFSERIVSGAEAGWVNFKEFLIDATYNWPYVAIGLIFFFTALLAFRSSRRRARQFKLQALQAQQQWILQQQQQNKTKDKTQVNN
jgi:hypothetical protein